MGTAKFDSINIHSILNFKLPLEFCQLYKEEISEQDFKYFYNPSLGETTEMHITPDFFDWLGYKGSVMEQYRSFEEELLKRKYSYTSKLPSCLSNLDNPPKNTILMIVPQVVYKNLILQLRTDKAKKVRRVIYVFYHWRNYQRFPQAPKRTYNEGKYSDVPEVKRSKPSNRSSVKGKDERDKSKSIPNFSMYYHNAGGMRTKSEKFSIKANNSSYDAFALTETWLNANYPDSDYFNYPKFNVYRKDRDYEKTELKRGGGVLFAIKSDYKSENIVLSNVSGNLDQLCIRVEIPLQPSSKIINVYFFVSYIRKMSRSEVYEALVKNITDIVNSTTDENCYFVICGDFNLSDVKWCNDGTEHEKTMLPSLCKGQNSFQLKTIESIMSLNMYQKNDSFNSSGNILDLIFVDKRLKAELKKASSELLKNSKHHEPLETKFDLSALLPTQLANVENGTLTPITPSSQRVRQTSAATANRSK